MEGPPRVFSLIKMSVKSLPVNQCLTAVPPPILPPPPLILPDPRHLKCTCALHIIKKKKVTMLLGYVCMFRLMSLRSSWSWKVKYTLYGHLLVWHRCEWHCVCAAKRKNVILNVSHKSASQLLWHDISFSPTTAADTLMIRSFVNPDMTHKVSLFHFFLPRCPTSLHPTPLCTRDLSEEKASANLVSRDSVSALTT